MDIHLCVKINIKHSERWATPALQCEASLVTRINYHIKKMKVKSGVLSAKIFSSKSLGAAILAAILLKKLNLISK